MPLCISSAEFAMFAATQLLSLSPMHALLAPCCRSCLEHAMQSPAVVHFVANDCMLCLLPCCCRHDLENQARPWSTAPVRGRASRGACRITACRSSVQEQVLPASWTPLSSLRSQCLFVIYLCMAACRSRPGLTPG
eukprot:1146324-Pelagomonas_calceolata.AAC.2